MMYTEFVAGTGCKDTPHNYAVFQSLEAIYMADDNLSKADIYKAGKLLVDNSKTPEEIRIERQIMSEIKEEQDSIEYYESEIVSYQMFLGIESDKEYIKEYKRMIKINRDRIAQSKRHIKRLEWVLAM